MSTPVPPTGTLTFVKGSVTQNLNSQTRQAEKPSGSVDPFTEGRKKLGNDIEKLYDGLQLLSYKIDEDGLNQKIKEFLGLSKELDALEKRNMSESTSDENTNLVPKLRTALNCRKEDLVGLIEKFFGPDNSASSLAKLNYSG